MASTLTTLHQVKLFYAQDGETVSKDLVAWLKANRQKLPASQVTTLHRLTPVHEYAVVTFTHARYPIMHDAYSRVPTGNRILYNRIFSFDAPERLEAYVNGWFRKNQFNIEDVTLNFTVLAHTNHRGTPIVQFSLMVQCIADPGVQ